METKKKKHIGHAACPFYLRENELHVECEGFLPKTVTAQMFTRKTQAEEYKHSVCYDGEKHQECVWYKLLMKEKYGEVRYCRQHTVALTSNVLFTFPRSRKNAAYGVRAVRKRA